MAKVKNKRNSGLADKVHGKKKGEIHKKKLNPFEVHINREKLKVLGKKSKHDRGLPGVSRAKAVQKRKETLGTEMRLMNKTNTFIDKRIGEKDGQLSAEDRMVARFAAERARHHGKKSIYNLADDEVLTHRGQTLEQIEKFDDPRSDDEGDEDRSFGGLGDDFVSEGHFGGGMLSKAGHDGAKSHKDLIEQLIAESKKRKVEKQKEKEQTLDLTEKLDSEWKDLQPVVFKKMRVEEKPKEKESVIDRLLSQQEKKSDDYDKMMRELKFEKRGTPSDGLKTDEKQSREERQRLEQLEREREQRMLADQETAAPKGQTTSKHRSADDLEDNFELEDEQQFMLAYDKDGNPLVPKHVLNDYSVPNAKPKFQDGVSDTSSEEDDDDDESDGNDTSNDNDEQNEVKHCKVTKDKRTNDEDEETSSDDDASDDSETESNVKEVKMTKEKRKKDDKEQSSSKNKKASEDKQINLKKDRKDYNDECDDESSDKSNQEQARDNKRSKSKKIDETPQTEPIRVENKKAKESNKKGKAEGNLQNHKSEVSESILFQSSANGELIKNDSTQESDYEESDSGDENEAEESSDEQGEDINDSKANKDDLADLKMSDNEGSEDGNDQIEDTEKIDSFFAMKSSEGDNLKELLADKTPYQQSVAIQKLIKNYDPSLLENNKDKLSRIYAHMLQYIHDIFTDLRTEGDVLKAFLIFDKLAPYFYDLAHTNKVSIKKYMVELLKEKHDLYKKRPKKMPDLNTLIFFKLISLIYPTSDFKHPVTSPALLFMSEILTTAQFTDAHSISRGFFVLSLVLEYTVLSKRFVPSAVNFLRGILYLTANTSILNPIQVVPPFKIHRDAKILNLEHDCSKNKMVVEDKMAAKDLVSNEIDDDFKIRCLLVSTMMLKEIFDNLADLEALECIFEPHLQLYSRIDLDFYPKKVASKVNQVIKHMKGSLEVKTYAPLAREKKKPKALRLYEPDIQEVFTGSKNPKLSREQAQTKRLQGKIKREMKGALREIRRDKAYIGAVKIRQKIQSDNVRKDKVKQIYKDAAIQQGEINKLKRIK